MVSTLVRSSRWLFLQIHRVDPRADFPRTAVDPGVQTRRSIISQAGFDPDGISDTAPSCRIVPTHCSPVRRADNPAIFRFGTEHSQGEIGLALAGRVLCGGGWFLRAIRLLAVQPVGSAPGFASLPATASITSKNGCASTAPTTTITRFLG